MKGIIVFLLLIISSDVLANNFVFREPLNGVYSQALDHYPPSPSQLKVECHLSSSVGKVGTEGNCADLLIVDNNLIRTVVDADGTYEAYGEIWSADDLYTGQVTDMEALFRGKSDFNEDIGYWDTSNVTNMEKLFEDASSFNQNINSWDVSKVESLYKTFSYALAFN